METMYLFLSLAIGSLRFVLWYNFSPSLRLPKAFQIQFDINFSYFNRILRRRLAGFLIYGVLPFVMIFHFKVLGEVDLARDLNISFAWNDKVTFWVSILLPLSILFTLLNGRRGGNLVEYPEIRISIWTTYMIITSAVCWILYLVALEFLFRGMVLQSIYMNAQENRLMAIILSTGLYSMIHYFKNNRISFLSIPYGLISAYVTLDSGSLIPTLLMHTVGGLLTEWVAIYQHPELRYEFKV